LINEFCLYNIAIVNGQWMNHPKKN
jgi:hypothetical protein